MSTTSAKVKNAWNARNYDQIALVLPKGQKEELKSHASKKDGGSVNAAQVKEQRHCKYACLKRANMI